jgi:2'-5' RNA ligase
VFFGKRTPDAFFNKLLGTQSPIAATLGPTSSFPPSATREVAVVVATVDSPELHALYQRLGEVTEFAEPIHEYEPHVTALM